MKIYASLITMLLISSLSLAALPLANAMVTPPTITAPWGAPPTVDGTWTGTEWDNVPEYLMKGPGGTSYIRVKHDNSHLFIIIDSPWDTSVASVYDSENCWTAFDAAHNHGSDPQVDDWLFDNPHSSSQVDLEAWNGTGSGWGDPAFGHLALGFYAEGSTRNPGPGLQTSPHSSTPHRIDEIKVPLECAVKLCTSAGFYALVVDDTDPSNYVEWPSSGGNPTGWPPWENPNPAPDAWGDLILGPAPSLMHAPPVAVSVTVDGIWSTGEWDDAPQYVMGGPGCQKGFVRAKFNATHLLVVIDSPWDTTPSTLYYHENAWLAFDTLNDGGFTPLADDYMIHASTEFTQMGWQGYPAGGNWTMAWLGWAGAFACAQAGANFGAFPLQTSPNSATPHRITEFAVPLNLVGYSPSTVGFYVMIDDDSTDPDGTGYLPPTSYAEWPLGSGGTPGWPGAWGFAPPSAPMAWGKLILASPPTVHDVAVTQILPLKTVIGQTHTCGINVTLANEGASSETFDVALYANTTTIGTKAVTVASGSSVVVTFGWNTTGCTKGNYTMSAFAWPVADEIDTADNTLVSGEIKVVTPGDVNADGVVNIVDSAGISAHWYPGPPIGPLGYHVDYDVDEDGKIGIQDAALVSAYWTGPPKGPLAE